MFRLVKICKLLLRTGGFVLRNVWAFFALLLILQLGVLYVAVSDIKLPQRVTERIFEALEKEGFKCSAEEIRLQNLTVLTATGVRADLSRGREPVCRIRRCSVKLAPSGLISGNWIPAFLYIDGAELFCPSVNSASGLSEKLVSDGALVARRKDGMIEIAAARCRIQDAPVVVWGEIPGTRDFFQKQRAANEATDAVPSEDASAGDTSKKMSGELARFAGRFSAVLQEPVVQTLLDTSSLFVELSTDGPNAVAQVNGRWRELDFDEHFVLKNVEASQRILISAGAETILPTGMLRIHADSLSAVAGDDFTEKVFGNFEELGVSAELPKTVFTWDAKLSERLPDAVFLRAGKMGFRNLEQGAIETECFLARIAPVGEWSISGKFDVAANLTVDDTEIAVAGVLSAGESAPSLDFRYDFTFDKSQLYAFPQTHFLWESEDFKALRFSEFPRVCGRVRFSEGMKFDRVWFEFVSGETRCGALRFEDVALAGIVTPELFHLEKIQARGRNFLANADVYSEFADGGKFRVRAWGSIEPSYLDERLGWFWERIWRDLRLASGTAMPRADIDVYWRWGERWEYIYGAIAGENCYSNGVLVDKLSLRIYEDPLLITAFDMKFLRGEDFASGDLQWHYAMEPTYHYRDFRFLFDGSFPPKDVLQIIGEGLPEVLSELSAERAATAVVRGFFSGSEKFYEDRIIVEMNGSLPGKFSIFGLEGENFNGRIFYDNGEVFVGSPFIANVDSGLVSGKIHVSLPEDPVAGMEGTKVALALDLIQVPHERLMEMLAAVGERVEGTEVVVSSEDSPEEEDALPEDHENSAMISGHFSGQLMLPNINSLVASGDFEVEDQDLFELQVFGGFSRLLSALKIDLTTFRLNEAEGTFRIQDGVVFLPDLHIFGESGEINVQADVFLADLGIRGEAVFRNLRGTRIPLFGKLIEWGTSPTALLPVSISGTVTEPIWKLAPKLSRIWSTPEAKFGIAPEKGEADEE